MSEISANPFHSFLSEFQQYIFDDSGTIPLLLAAWLTGGHVLLEGPPGVAKTSAVKVMAALLGKGVKRVQFTPDLMPTDITGFSMPATRTLNEGGARFEFVPGPVFTDILIADEINRAPARTQSALLEAMEEKSVTVDGLPRALPEGFWVLATQNPREMEGTYQLPEAQMDRFAVILQVQYPSAQTELRLAKALLSNRIPIPFHKIQPSPHVQHMKTLWEQMRPALVWSEPLLQYAVKIVRETRKAEYGYGASPRALFHLLNLAGALCICGGRTTVDFDDIKSVAPAVLSHRLQGHWGGATLDGASRVRKVQQILESIAVPRS